MLMVPTEKEIGILAVPETTGVPLTVTVGSESDTVGVTVNVDGALGRMAVYAIVPEAKVGLRIPELIASPERSALSEGGTAVSDIMWPAADPTASVVNLSPLARVDIETSTGT
jgi:hypothetical protein